MKFRSKTGNKNKEQKAKKFPKLTSVLYFIKSSRIKKGYSRKIPKNIQTWNPILQFREREIFNLQLKLMRNYFEVTIVAYNKY